MDKIVSKGIFIMPLGNYLYTVGSTYNHQEWDGVVTQKGITYLQKQIEQILEYDYEVITAKAGVRPTVRDRKPFLGLHPKHEKLAIFNGLGTRGVIQGPYLSAHFSTFLTASQKNTQISDIQRYKELFDG